MTQTILYLVAALALGAVSYFGSEAAFWSFPPEDLDLSGLAVTIIAYALACATVLSVVAWTGARCRAGLFLAAALLGFLVEGVIVATMYEAFPVQLVWTPLAWHAVVTGLVVIWLPRVAACWPVHHHAAAMIAAGLGLGLWSFYWPLERAVLPPTALTLAYLIGCGLLALLGHLVLDRIAAVPRPPRPVLAVMPLVAGILWILQTVADPRPERLAFPVMVGLTVWAMARLGRGGAGAGEAEGVAAREAPGFGAPSHALRPLVFVLMPLTAAAVAAFAVPVLGGFEVNALALLTLGPLGTGLWLWSLWRGVRAGQTGHRLDQRRR